MGLPRLRVATLVCSALFGPLAFASAQNLPSDKFDRALASKLGDICNTTPRSGERPTLARMKCLSDAFAAAPDDSLIPVMQVKADIIRLYLAVSPAKCGGLLGNPPHLWAPRSAPANADSIRFLNAVNAAQVAGATSPQRRTQSTSGDRRILVAGMLHRGVTQGEADAALSGRLQDLPVERRCKVQWALFDTAANAPKAAAGRLTVRLVGGMFAPPD
jgi:hypothetical protein